MRGVIASRMQASLQEMAQLTLGTDATMDAAMEFAINSPYPDPSRVSEDIYA